MQYAIFLNSEAVSIIHFVRCSLGFFFYNFCIKYCLLMTKSYFVILGGFTSKCGHCWKTIYNRNNCVTFSRITILLYIVVYHIKGFFLLTSLTCFLALCVSICLFVCVCLVCVCVSIWPFALLSLCLSVTVLWIDCPSF